MSAKDKIKNIGIISGWVFLVASLFVLAGFVEVEQKNIECKNIRISVDYQGGDMFISQEEVKAMIGSIFNGQINGKPIKDLSIERINAKLFENPYISKSRTYTTVDGILNIEILQYKPILRVFNTKGQSFYVSTEGMMLPVSEQYIARVPVASGFINDEYSISRNLVPGRLNWDEADKSLTSLQKLYLMARYLEYHEFFKAQIDQIYVNSYKEIELIPKVGDHLVIFGGIDNLEEKFDKLMAFYSNGLRANGWSKYNILNIKYKNQVICSKK